MPESVPCVGAATIEYVSASPSTSLAGRPTDWGVSSASVAELAVATGASFTGFTVSETVAVLELFTPSLDWKVKESGPL